MCVSIMYGAAKMMSVTGRTTKYIVSTWLPEGLDLAYRVIGMSICLFVLYILVRQGLADQGQICK